MRFIALLRGINVGGHKKIKMAELKLMFEALSFTDVVTYIQSGNVIFTASEDADLDVRIQQGIHDTFGFDVPVFIRSAAEVQSVYDGCPYENIDLKTDGTSLLVTFLSEQPQADFIPLLTPFISAPEKCVVVHKEVYLHCPEGYGKTKLSNPLIEKKLKVQATTRNWKTVNKLLELANK